MNDGLHNERCPRLWRQDRGAVGQQQTSAGMVPVPGLPTQRLQHPAAALPSPLLLGLRLGPAALPLLQQPRCQEATRVSRTLTAHGGRE